MNDRYNKSSQNKIIIISIEVNNHTIYKGFHNSEKQTNEQPTKNVKKNPTVFKTKTLCGSSVFFLSK